ncbi:hypothetical protein AAE478_002952 [Parahypoxylon ruwenzoriense]
MAPRQTILPLIYRVFFLVIEPTLALAGAFYAHFRQAEYLAMTAHEHVVSAAPPPQGATSVVLSQLANMYLLFALNEALVLRATGDLHVWRTVLFAFLVADLGHLYSLSSLGPESLWVYWDATRWNAMDWGNVPVVYLGATMRIAFLAGVGMGKPAKDKK